MRVAGWQVLLLGGILSGCSKPPAAPPAALPAPVNDKRLVAVRLDSTSLVYLGDTNEIVAYSPRGTEAWRFAIPDGAPIQGRLAVAANSNAYARTARSLIAIGVRGELVWSVELPLANLPTHLASPVPLPDSGVVVAVAVDRLQSFNADGHTKGFIELAPGTRLKDAPQVAPNGAVLIATDTALLWYSDGGAPLAQQPFSRSAEAPRPTQ